MTSNLDSLAHRRCLHHKNQVPKVFAPRDVVPNGRFYLITQGSVKVRQEIMGPGGYCKFSDHETAAWNHARNSSLIHVRHRPRPDTCTCKPILMILCRGRRGRNSRQPNEAARGLDDVPSRAIDRAQGIPSAAPAAPRGLQGDAARCALESH